MSTNCLHAVWSIPISSTIPRHGVIMTYSNCRCKQLFFHDFDPWDDDPKQAQEMGADKCCLKRSFRGWWTSQVWHPPFSGNTKGICFGINRQNGCYYINSGQQCPKECIKIGADAVNHVNQLRAKSRSPSPSPNRGKGKKGKGGKKGGKQGDGTGTWAPAAAGAASCPYYDAWQQCPNKQYCPVCYWC